jgi:hypothetical protein
MSGERPRVKLRRAAAVRRQHHVVHKQNDRQVLVSCRSRTTMTPQWGNRAANPVGADKVIGVSHAARLYRWMRPPSLSVLSPACRIRKRGCRHRGHRQRRRLSHRPVWPVLVVVDEVVGQDALKMTSTEGEHAVEHSRRTVPTKRSAKVLAGGARIGVPVNRRRSDRYVVPPWPPLRVTLTNALMGRLRRSQLAAGTVSRQYVRNRLDGWRSASRLDRGEPIYRW